MLSFKSAPVLLVAPDIFPIDLLAQSQVKHVADIGRVFPSIFEVKPKAILLDYDYLGKDTEKLLYRLRGNPFYHKIKIYCYKANRHEKTDSLLKALGVHEVFLKEEFKKAKENISTVSRLKNTFNPTVLNLLVNVSC